MKILISGTSGFLGGIIKIILSKHNIYDLNRNFGNYKINLQYKIPLFLENFDLVIHAAGKAHSYPKTENDEQEFFNVNVIGTQNLLKGIERTSIPKYFVFISSVAVYGKEIGLEVNETTFLGATDPYGLSKIEAENIVLDWCNRNKVICTILRLPLIVGPNPPGNLGAMINGIRKGLYFNIAGGKTNKSMVLAEDVANFIIKASEIGGIYNLTDGYHPSFSELSNHIALQLGKREPMNIPFWLARIIANLGDLLGKRAPLNTNKLNKITSDLTFDDSRARVAFGWDPTPILDGFNINK